MRTSLTIKLEYDTKVSEDDERRETFLELALTKARELYGLAGVLAETPPAVTVFTIDHNGRTHYPIFETEELPE